MQSIKYNKENYLTLSQIYYKLADLQKQITLCNGPAQMGIKENEEVDKAAKHYFYIFKDDQKLRMAKVVGKEDQQIKLY